MNIAVTGATGFVGRHFIASALAQGHHLRAWVRGPSAHAAAWRARAITVIEGALTEPTAAQCAAFLHDVDALVFLAAAGVQSRDRSLDKTLAANVTAPARWLEHAAQHHVRRVVLTGTCLEYRGFGALPAAPWGGAPNPLCGLDSPLSQADLYGASKGAGGLLARAVARHAGMPLWYLRLASLYGPGDDAGKFVPAALAHLRAGNAFPMSPGEQVREWLHIDDAVRALLLAAACDPGPDSVRTLNIGTGQGVSLADLVARLAGVVGASAETIQRGAIAYRPHEVHHLVMDVQEQAPALQFTPAWSLERGLEQLAH